MVFYWIFVVVVVFLFVFCFWVVWWCRVWWCSTVNLATSGQFLLCTAVFFSPHAWIIQYEYNTVQLFSSSSILFSCFILFSFSFVAVVVVLWEIFENVNLHFIFTTSALMLLICTVAIRGWKNFYYLEILRTICVS